MYSVLSPLPDSSPQALEIKPEALPSSVTPAYVATVVSPSQIYIQLTKSEQELASLLDDMYTYYTSSKVLPLATVHQGAICAAPFSVDGNWYRVKVVSVKQVSEQECLGGGESRLRVGSGLKRRKKWTMCSSRCRMHSLHEMFQ